MASPSDTAGGDATTTAEIVVSYAGTPTVKIAGITAFSYSSDVQQVGDPFSVTVPDPRGLYANGLRKGSTVVLSLCSPAVAGGAAVRKLTGIVIRREVSCTNSGGTVISLTGADLGWHLTNNDGPLWFNLQGGTFDDLAQMCIHPNRKLPQTPDPMWGFADEVMYSNLYNVTAKQGSRNDAAQASLRQGKAGVRIEQQGAPLIPLARIQIEPGQKLFQVLAQYAMRMNLFVNVTADGQLCVFAPNDDKPPAYHFYAYASDDVRRTKNNVRGDGIKVTDDISELFTTVQCVGDLPLPDLADQAKAQDDVNALRFHGEARDPSALPFLRQSVFGDGEAMNGDQAKRRAFWRLFQGKFNAHVVTFSVRGHHQDGIWYESDTMASLDFPVVGISGNYYISAVRCDRDQGGDRTMITCHTPQLLSAFVAQTTR